MAGKLSITEAVDKFVNNIKKKYKRGRRIIQEEQLLGCRSEKLVRLEVVEKKRLQASEQRGNRGSEDSEVTRTPLAYADLFKVEEGREEIKTILIDGDAGIGKTTFCIAVCEDWADGKIFQEFKLVLLLPLREQEVALAGSLLDLLKLLHPNPKVCDLVKDYFEEDGGSILVIADGWDKLGNEKYDKGTFLYKLLFGSQYSSVSVIVTSRPSASASLHYSTCIDRFAEICGFDKEHIVEYIKSEFEDDQTVASDILKKLESNPLVEGICSIPLNCAIICHLWLVLKEDFPTTMTGLYTKVILNIIIHSIHKFQTYENIVSLSSFDDLPETLQQSWWLLCEFAFQTLKEDKLVFSDKELRDFFPQGLSLDNDILCFGLLQSSISMLEVGCGRSFHFLHLTFQEYLAALFLVKQKSCEVAVADSGSLISGLTNLFEVPMKNDYRVFLNYKGSIVLRFFFGIAYTFEIFQNGIGQRILTSLIGLDDRCLPLDLVLCYWAFEAHNDQFVRVVIDKLNGSYTLPHVIHDFVAVAYVIAKIPECTDEAISLRGFGLRDYHLTMLTDILTNKDGKLQVRSLELIFNELTVRGMAGLFNRAAAAFQSLHYLALDYLNSSNMIDHECMNPILATLAQSLNEVVFSFENNELDVPSLKVFRDALCNHQLSNLTELYFAYSLSSDALANAEFIQALGHCCGLKVLDLSCNDLCAPGGRALGKILPQLSLEALDISDAKLSDEGMSALNQGLESTCHIGCLNLGNNDIHAAGILCLIDSICAGKLVIRHHFRLFENPLGLKGAEAVVRLLSSEHFLAENVELSSCELTTAEDNSAHSIFPHSVEPSITCAGFREWICGQEIKADGVKILNLFDSNFSGEGIHVLAGFMHLCPHLRSLDCVICDITSSDLKQLLSLLSQSNLNLEEWNLYGNNLDDDGVSALIEHLPMFPSLTDIKISQITPEMCRSLKEICEKRKGKIAKVDSPMLGPESGAGTDVNNQCSIPDSVEPTTTEPHPFHQEFQKATTVVAEGKVPYGEDASDNETPPSTPAAKRVKLQEDESEGSILEARAILEDKPHSFHQEFQKVTTVVTEGKVSYYGQSEDSSDNETPPSTPAAKRVKLQEDESKGSIFEAKATLEDTMSSLSDTSGLGEDESAWVAGEEVIDQLPPTVESGIDEKICHTFKFPPSVSMYYQCSQNVASVPFLSQVEILTCDSSGCEYYNYSHGITLRIPGDAIPPGMIIHLEVAVALYGPFQFPDGSCPISPILWLCIQENVNLRKPIDIILPHFLTDAKNLGIRFAKADHKQYATDEFGQNRYIFEPLETPFIAYKERNQNYGVLSTQHCCFLCITSKVPQISREFALKAEYYLWCIEKPSTTSRTRDTLHLCATFCLPTCRKIVKSQYTEREGYYIRRPPKMFTFKDSGDTLESCLSIKVKDEGCVMAADPENKQIKASQIYFWDKRDKLEMLQADKVYPPSVTLTLEVLEDLPVKLLIKFNGSTADDDMGMEILLPLASAARNSHVRPSSPATIDHDSQWITTATPEYRTIVECTSSLTLAIKNHLVDLSAQLLERHLITAAQESQMRNEIHSPESRAATLVELIRDRVKQNPKHYQIFIEALKADQLANGSILEQLRGKYESLCKVPIGSPELSEPCSPAQVQPAVTPPPAGQSEPQPTTTGHLLGINDLGHILEAVWEARKKWYYLGLKLGMSPKALDKIKVANQNNNDSSVTEVIKEWLSSDKDDRTWTSVAKALSSPIVGYAELANQLPQHAIAS